MPITSDDVRFRGKTRSRRTTVKPTRLIHYGHPRGTQTVTADFQRIFFDNAVAALRATNTLKSSEPAPELVNWCSGATEGLAEHGDSLLKPSSRYICPQAGRLSRLSNFVKSGFVRMCFLRPVGDTTKTSVSLTPTRTKKPSIRPSMRRMTSSTGSFHCPAPYPPTCVMCSTRLWRSGLLMQVISKRGHEGSP